MTAPSLGQKLYSLLMFFVVSALGGLLTAGLVVPTAGVASEVTRQAARAVQQIPAEFETPPVAEGSKVLMADGSELTNFYEENRVNVTLDQVSPIMQQAQVAVEDQRFFEHGALDLRGTLRALVRTSSGNTQGGSTLTQQYVKLVLLNKAVADGDKEALAAAQNRTFARKILELRYAIALEQKVSKKDILAAYLNLAYYGDRSYGVQSAARHYFNVDAKDLNLPQAAMLAGLVRNPATTDPVKHEKLAIERRNNVLDVLVKEGIVTVEEATAAKKVPFDRSQVQNTKHGCLVSRYPHLCSIVELTLTRMTPSLGPDEDSRRNLLNRGGLLIQTEIDPRFQDAAQTAVSNYIAPTDQVIGAMVMIQPGTGLIKAAAQSRPEIGTGPGQTYYNYTMDAVRGGAEGVRGGSTFKAFTITAAINKGIPTSRTYESPASIQFQGQRFRTCNGSVTVRSPWEVNTRPPGTFDMYDGARYSSNTFFVQLEQDTGLCEVTTMAERLGLKMANGRSIVKEFNEIPSFTLGAVDISPVSLVNAYATLAARGLRCDPIILKSAVSAAGKNYEVPSANCEQVIPQRVADAAVDVLKMPFSSGGTAAPANIPGYDIAGKTGTDNKAPTIWTVGVTPQLAGGAMITVDKRAPRYIHVRNENRTLQGAPRLGGKATLAASSGREAGGGIWRPAMEVALPLLPKGNFIAPAAQELGPMTPIPNCNALSFNDCKNALQNAGFGALVVRQPSDKPIGTLLGYSPRGQAPLYSNVKVFVSSGPPLPPDPNAPPP